MSRSSFLVVVLLSLLGACTTTTNGYSRPTDDDRAKDPEGNERVMYLYRIDVDPAAVAKGAPLLFQEPPPQEEYGLTRRAQGVFSVSDSGYCRIEVKVAEPVMGLDGRRNEQVYTLLKFFGRASDDGARATTMAGEDVNVASFNQSDEVQFFERGRDKISIQAQFRGSPSAYILHFQHAAVPKRDVPVPWKATKLNP